MSSNLRFAVLAALSGMAVFSSGCNEKRKPEQNAVIMHYMTEPVSLHPTNGTDESYRTVQEYLQRTLTRIDMRNYSHIPILVKALPEVSPDGLDYTYELRDDVRWDDGSKLTPDDIAFTMKVIKCPLTNNPANKAAYLNIQGITPDPSHAGRFTIRMREIYYKNPHLMDEVYIMQRSTWDSTGIFDNIPMEAMDDEKFDPAKYKGLEKWIEKFNSGETGRDLNLASGLGPYKVISWQTGSSLTLEKKKEWWGKSDTLIYNQAHPEKIIFRYFSDDASIKLALKKQTIDVTTQISTVSLLELMKDQEFNRNYESGFVDQYSYNYLAMNMKPDGQTHKPFFIDKRVRLAMAYLVPIDEIVNTMAGGRATRQASFVQPINKGYYNDTLKLIPMDLGKAKKLLTEAGWTDTDGDNIRDKMVDGEKVQFSFLFTYKANPVTKQILLMTKENMYKAGIDFTPNPVDQALWQQLVYGHDFDLIAGAWYTGATPEDPQELFHTSNWANSGANFTGFGNAETDKVIGLSNKTIDPNERAFYLKKLQAMVYDEMPYIFMFAVKRKVAISRKFENRGMYAERPGVMLNNLKLPDSE
jgi:peptide/nickel transport system substrate-binding protein